MSLPPITPSAIPSAAPLVTVVIATRDRPQMLREAIASVRAQDYPGPIEVVVVADRSEPDLTLEADDGRVSVRAIANARRPGLAGARNTGIEAAHGELVAFCDDDDLWLPGKLTRQVAALTARPEAVLCCCGIRVAYDEHTHDRVLPATEVGFAALLADRHTELHPSTFLARTAALRGAVGLVEEEVPGGFGEDYELLLRCARASPVLNVPEPLAVVRWGTQSFFFRRWETMAAGLSWLLARYPEFETSPRGSSRIHGQIAFAHAAMGHRRQALGWAGRSMRRNPVEPRAVLALAVAARAVTPDRVMEALHHRGRGI